MEGGTGDEKQQVFCVRPLVDRLWPFAVVSNYQFYYALKLFVHMLDFRRKCICIKIKVVRPLHCLTKIGLWKPFRHTPAELILRHANTSFNDSTISRWSWIWWFLRNECGCRTARSSEHQMAGERCSRFTSSFVVWEMSYETAVSIPSNHDWYRREKCTLVIRYEHLGSIVVERESKFIFYILFDPRESAWSPIYGIKTILYCGNSVAVVSMVCWSLVELLLQHDGWASHEPPNQEQRTTKSSEFNQLKCISPLAYYCASVCSQRNDPSDKHKANNWVNTNTENWTSELHHIIAEGSSSGGGGGSGPIGDWTFG